MIWSRGQESGNSLSALQGALAGAERAEAGAGAAARAARDACADHGRRARLLRRARDDDAAALRDKAGGLDDVCYLRVEPSI